MMADWSFEKKDIIGGAPATAGLYNIRDLITSGQGSNFPIIYYLK